MFIHTMLVLYVQYKCCVGVFSICVKMSDLAVLCCPCVFMIPLNSIHDETLWGGPLSVYSAIVTVRSGMCRNQCIGYYHAERHR